MESPLLDSEARVDVNHNVVEAMIEESGAPGGTVVHWSAKTGTRIEVAGFRKHNDPAPITETDMWHLGSNTKAMTATLVARLLEKQSELSWESTIMTILEYDVMDWSSVVHDSLKQVSLQELVHHRSGLRPNLSMWWQVRPRTSREHLTVQDRRSLMNTLLAQKPYTERGQYLYSNCGYTVVAFLIDVWTGESFEDLMEEEVWGPLQMSSAKWGPPGQSGLVDEPRGHDMSWTISKCFPRKVLVALEPNQEAADNPPVINSAGRACMAMADYAKFLKAHCLKDASFLPSASWEKLHTPVGDYAMGWQVVESPRDKAIQLLHAGSNTHWYVAADVIPQREEFAVTAQNFAGNQKSVWTAVKTVLAGE